MLAMSDAPPRQAVILAGGQGSRLRPHTDTRPKAMMRRLAGFPIEGYWRAIDTAKDITEATAELRSAAEPPS